MPCAKYHSLSVDISKALCDHLHPAYVYMSLENYKMKISKKVPIILIGITAGALFSGIFWIECTIATKKNTRSVVFMELCLLDLLLMIIPAVWLLLA